jgi:hypothetical protein
MVKEANGPIDMKGLSGDPNNNELNVWGVLLKYKEDGTLYDSAGNKVGMLRCYFSFHNCDTYLSKDDCSSAKRIAALGKPQVCRKTPVASQILKAPEPTEARIAPAQ